MFFIRLRLTERLLGLYYYCTVVSARASLPGAVCEMRNKRGQPVPRIQLAFASQSNLWPHRFASPATLHCSWNSPCPTCGSARRSNIGGQTDENRVRWRPLGHPELGCVCHISVDLEYTLPLRCQIRRHQFATQHQDATPQTNLLNNKKRARITTNLSPARTLDDAPHTPTP